MKNPRVPLVALGAVITAFMGVALIFVASSYPLGFSRDFLGFVGIVILFIGPYLIMFMWKKKLRSSRALLNRNRYQRRSRT